jgi:hypothetical protein
MGVRRKDALAKMLGLVPQVERHLEKIAAEPASRDIRHWQAEIRSWLNQMEALVPHVGKKTAQEWQARIESWRAQLG